MKISFISTVFNEEKTIKQFLESLLSQTKLPNEIIIVDGGSSDNTIDEIKKFKKENKKYKGKFSIIFKKGNRSVGRNEAIKRSTGDIIACSDSGNILDKNWLKNISKPFSKNKIDVVAGYYKGLAKSIFQKCLIPYVLVMPDKVNPDYFLPATRSLAFRKSILKKSGNFNEELSHNEDYEFARRLKKIGANIYFAKNALVYWLPRNNLFRSFIMFFRFSFGDAQAGIFRPKMILIFIRYILFFSLLQFALLKNLNVLIYALLLVLFIYFIWAIKKNYKHVLDIRAFYILPILQITSDFAVISGTFLAVAKNLLLKIKQNKILSFIIFLYVVSVFPTLSYGTPNADHPFTYHMDEWHQLAAIKAIAKEGTTTIPGAAQIPFLYPVFSAVYLIPFMLFGIIDPFLVKSAFDNLDMQQKLFEILRSTNIIFGVASIMMIYISAKNYLKINKIIPTFLFAFAPVFVMLSGYFKYDIGLLFFITLAIAYLLKFSEEPSRKNFIYSSIASGLAMSVKFSAVPLIPILIFSFILFKPSWYKKISELLFGLIIYVFTFLIFGIPNIFIGKADYQELLFSNLVQAPQETANYLISSPWWIHLPVKLYPYLFGHLFYYLFFVALIYLILYSISKSHWKSKSSKKIILLLFSLFLFAGSLISLKIGAIGNRVLVLLPFMTLIVAYFFTLINNNLNKIFKYFLSIILIIVMLTQFLETSIWLYTKLSSDPQRESSEWIKANIPAGKKIGIENIPIYQALPNIVLKEFYEKEYIPEDKNKYLYTVIDSSANKLPEYVIITNAGQYAKLFKASSKNDIINNLEKQKYEKIKEFSPDLTYFRLIGDSSSYFFSALSASPYSISIYKKIYKN